MSTKVLAASMCQEKYVVCSVPHPHHAPSSCNKLDQEHLVASLSLVQSIYSCAPPRVAYNCYTLRREHQTFSYMSHCIGMMSRRTDCERTFGFVWWTKVCKDVVGRPSSALFEHALSWNISCPIRIVVEDWLAEYSN